MPLLSPLGPQFFNNDGTVAAGCKLYTRLSGTSTQATAYEDQAGAVAHSYPITLDSAGKAQPHIWLTAGVEYRFRLETAAGAMIDEWDDISGIPSALAIVQLSDYGADNTGVADSSSSFNSAISAISANGGGTLLIGPGTYRFVSSTSFTLPSGTHLLMHGATLNFSGASASSRLRVTGSIGSNVLLTANVAAGDQVIPVVSATGLAAGDLLLLSSDTLVPLNSIGGSTTETIGEFVTIKSISGLNLTINGYLDTAYTTVANAKIQKVTPSENVVIEGGTILGFGISGTDTSTLESGISAIYARKLTVRDVTINKCDYNGVRVDQSYDFDIDNLTVLHQERASTSHAAVIQYGVSIIGASAVGKLRGVTVINGKHGIAWSENTLPGVGRDVSISGAKIVGTWGAAIATHESNTQLSISDSDLIGCARGIDMRVREFSINNVRIRSIPGAGSIGDGVLLQENAGDGEIIDLRVNGCRYGIRGYDTAFPSGAAPSNIKIKGGWMRNINQIGIYLEHSENATAKKGISITGVDIDDFGADGIRLNGEFDSAIIRGNTFRCASAPTGYGVRLMGTLNTRVVQNDFIGMVPVRLENDTQGAPVAPRNPLLVGNTWDHTTAFLSAATGASIVNQDNVEIGAPSVTIAAGVITIPAGVQNIIVDTEAAAATDDLDTINGGNTGDIIFLRAASDARTVVVKDATGNIRLSGDFSLTHSDDLISLRWSGAVWQQIATADSTV